MKIHGPILCAMLIPHSAAAQVLNCNLDGYKPVEGLTATVREGVLEVKWRGERAQQLRAEFAIQNDQPIVRELASRISGANWIVLGRDLAPEFQVTSGVRRLATSPAGSSPWRRGCWRRGCGAGRRYCAPMVNCFPFSPTSKISSFAAFVPLRLRRER